jgi:hypothetical protein
MIVNRRQIDTSNTYMHGYSISWFGTGTSIKGDGVKLQVLSFLHVQGIIR